MEPAACLITVTIGYGGRGRKKRAMFLTWMTECVVGR